MLFVIRVVDGSSIRSLRIVGVPSRRAPVVLGETFDFPLPVFILSERVHHSAVMMTRVECKR